LPSEEEWLALARSTGGYYELAERRAIGDPTRSYLALLTGGPSGFNARLGGSGGLAQGGYADLNEDGMYSSRSTCGADSTVYIVFNGKNRRVLRDCWTPQLAVSVRCVEGD
jgi:hypothetical protein